jgi:hypothetical protein
LAGCQKKVTSPKWQRHTIDDSSLGADGVRTEDVNQDGLPDLVAGWEQGGVSRVYLMQRDSGMKPIWIQTDAGPALDVEDALLVDLDQDGAVDVISSTEGKNKKVLIHWAPKRPEDYTVSTKWRTETLFEDGSLWMFATALDIDGKNGPDIVVGGKNQNGKIGWLQSPPDPRKVSDWKFHFLTNAGWTMSLLKRDMDNDGDEDILLSDRKGDLAGIHWLENPGRAQSKLTEPWKNHWIKKDIGEPMLIDTYDFDGDGIEEIAVPYYIDNQGFILIMHTQDRTNWTDHPVPFPPNMGRAKSLAVGDINLDGKPDLVLSTEHADNRSGVIWLEYQDSWDEPNWTTHDISGLEGNKFDLNLLLDLDADGDLDVLNTEENNNSQDGKAGLGLIWYENPANP